MSWFYLEKENTLFLGGFAFVVIVVVNDKLRISISLELLFCNAWHLRISPLAVSYQILLVIRMQNASFRLWTDVCFNQVNTFCQHDLEDGNHNHFPMGNHYISAIIETYYQHNYINLLPLFIFLF